ncbi:hypothetical protein NUV26_00700 [Burkholderia pseudomultivorans]|uniref:hypothetical protein n=1 Tax=Burkholderia pseudomultivorans TaxID=1207504 RepID=UPI001E47A055|nr:hypothetical protein [Burkholderia pseudomultivorans]MDS0790653.1 hypothetical protein [Burkholderia pseudomultivorans]
MIVTLVLPVAATTDGTFAPEHVTVVPLPGAVAEHAAWAPTGIAPVRIAIPPKPRLRVVLFIVPLAFIGDVIAANRCVKWVISLVLK